MRQQRKLPLANQAPLDELWEVFPKRCREELITLWARLMVRTARIGTPTEGKEPTDENAR